MQDTIIVGVKTSYQHWIDSKLQHDNLPSNPYDIPQYLIDNIPDHPTTQLSLLKDRGVLYRVIDSPNIDLSLSLMIECVFDAIAELDETQYNRLIESENDQIVLMDNCVLDRDVLINTIKSMKTGIILS